MARLFGLIPFLWFAVLPEIARSDDLQNADFEEGTKGWSVHVFGAQPRVEPDVKIRHGGK